MAGIAGMRPDDAGAPWRKRDVGCLVGWKRGAANAAAARKMPQAPPNAGRDRERSEDNKAGMIHASVGVCCDGSICNFDRRDT